MKPSLIRYLVGALMVLFGIYKLINQQPWEFGLYLCAGLGFVSIGLIGENKFPQHKKFLNIFSWVMIGLAVFFFLFLLRTDNLL